MTSAKYLSIRLNITKAPTSSTSVMDAETAVSDQSGARPNTSTDRNPSTIALSGFRANSHWYFAETCDSGQENCYDPEHPQHCLKRVLRCQETNVEAFLLRRFE